MITNEVTITNESDKGHCTRTNPCDHSGGQALVAAAQAGITGAMDEWLARHKTLMYRPARRFTRSHEDAEDLVQDAMLRAFVNVRRFRKESQVGTWLIAIVNNAALSMMRRGMNSYFVSLDRRHEEVAGPEPLGFSRCSPQSGAADHAPGTAHIPARSTSAPIANTPDHPRALCFR